MPFMHEYDYEPENAATSKRRRFKRPSASEFGFWALVALVVLAIAGFIGGAVVAAQKHSTVRSATVTVCDKQIIPNANSGPSYEVFTDAQIFQIVSHVVNGVSLNPEQLYGALQKGTTYDITYDGFDKQSLKIYPNLLTAVQSTVQQPNACASQLAPSDPKSAPAQSKTS